MSRRAVLRWHGGKWKLAPWIIAHFPSHQIYVEPFGGAASVLLRKSRSYAEVYNDLDSEVVNLFRVLRSPDAPHFVEELRLTPFAREEFNDAYRAAISPRESARRLVIRSFMGFGSDGTNTQWRTGFRANSNRSGTTPAHDWANYAKALPSIIDRLRGVIIENRNALEVMAQHDSPCTLHYVDPPYVHSTRSPKARRKGGGAFAYRHELTDDDHRALVCALRGLSGFVVLSGYPNGIYRAQLPDWRCVTKRAHADGARERTECLWLSPRTDAAILGELRFGELAA